jgi:hypothetical protein
LGSKKALRPESGEATISGFKKPETSEIHPQAFETNPQDLGAFERPCGITRVGNKTAYSDSRCSEGGESSSTNPRISKSRRRLKGSRSPHYLVKRPRTSGSLLPKRESRNRTIQDAVSTGAVSRVMSRCRGPRKTHRYLPTSMMNPRRKY